MFDGIYRIKPVLDHLSTGLKACGILKVMKSFPELFLSLFVHTGEISNDDVCEALYSEDSGCVLDHLNRFVRELDKEGTFPPRDVNFSLQCTLICVFIDSYTVSFYSIKHSLYSHISKFHCVGLLAFVKHVTGIAVVKKRSIKVEVMDDPHGSISVHVCSNTIILPKGVFESTEESYQSFVQVMNVVMTGGSFSVYADYFP